MKLIYRVTVAAIAAATAFTGLTISTAHAAPVYDDNGPAVTVYNTPGGQIVNGRLWSTSCAKYSSTTVRCTTNLWGTIVVPEGGRYINKTGWHFNNLTYLPSSRTAWKNNPLGNSGEFTSAGRRWKTECDTAATGRGACRSYMWTKYVSGAGGKFTQLEGWVFNNQVLFATGNVKPVTTIPAHVIDQSVLTFDGLGPIGLRDTTDNLVRLGYLLPSEECGPSPSTFLQDRGVTPQTIWAGTGHVISGISLVKAGIRTEAGAAVGMTVGKVREIYGAAFTIEKKLLPMDDSEAYFGSVKDGDLELLFLTGPAPEGGIPQGSPTRLQGSDTITGIELRTYSTEVSGGC